MTIVVSVTGWQDPCKLPTESDIVLKSASGLTGTFTKFADEILGWCFDKGIEADFISKWSDDEYDYSHWRINDEAQRMIFLLRWS